MHLDAATPRQVEHGKRLVLENGYASCHEIDGIKNPENFAPELSRIGSKPISQLLFVEGVDHNLHSYVAAKVSNPRAFGSALKMPQFKLTPQQVDAITTALLAQTDRAAPSLRSCASRRFSSRSTSLPDMPGNSCMTCAAPVAT